MTDNMKMTRLTFSVGAFEVNCTWLVRNGRVWIVDPGSEATRMAARLVRDSLTPAGILLTHAHFDHVGAIPELQRRFPDLPVYVGEKDAPILAHPLNQMPPDYPPIPCPANLRLLQTGSTIDGLDDVRIIETPGHTPGGVCYYFPDDKLLLSGDTLFAGSVGRTDFPGGDMATLMSSLAALKALPSETIVVPGHGPETTIGRECANNPFLR